MTIGTSLLLIAIGAILKYAVTADVEGFDIQTCGVILMLIGILGLILSLLYTFVWSDGAQRRRQRRRRCARRPDAEPPRATATSVE